MKGEELKPVGEMTADEREREFADLGIEKKANAARAKEINARMRELMPLILQHWEAISKTGSKFSDATLFMKKSGYIKIISKGEKATDEEKAAVGEALIAAGYDSLVKPSFNSRSVSSVAKEEHWDQQLPEELKGLLQFDTDYVVEVRQVKQDEPDEEEKLDPVPPQAQ